MARDAKPAAGTPAPQGQEEYSPYRWVVLFMFAMVMFLASFSQYQPSFYAQELMDDLGIGTSGFAALTSFPMLLGLVLAFATGSLADKFGLKNIVTIGLAVTAVGALARCLCHDYTTLLLTSMTLGVAPTFTMPNTAKLAMRWFPRHQVSLAVGITMSMGTAGLTLAQAITGAVFATYHDAFLWGGILDALLVVAWAVFGRDKDAVVEDESGHAIERTTAERVRMVVRNRGLWLAGFGTFFYNGFTVTLGSFLITALIVNWGVDPVASGVTAAFLTLGAAVGAVILPPAITRNRHAKLWCILLPAVSVALVLLGWGIGSVPLRAAIFFVAGTIYGGVLPMFMLYPSILPGVDHDNSGTAGGLITVLNMLGSFVMPSFVITPIAGSDYNLIIILTCAFFVINSLVFALLPSAYDGEGKPSGKAD